jgi:hypothetical protein
LPEYDAITPAQWVLFLWSALIAFTIMWWLFWRTGRNPGTPIERDEAGALEIVNRAWIALLHWRPVVMESGVSAEGNRDAEDDENSAVFTGSDVEPEPPNPPNLALESRTEERTGSFGLNHDERLAVYKMIAHRSAADKPTKASTIYAGFTIKKGESAAYRRASEIYDALFVMPEEMKFPNRTPEQDEERRNLGLAV